MIKLFFSYSHQDEALRNELDKHLAILKRSGTIDVWHDRRITPGSNIDTAIDINLRTADLILLLVSPDFLSSDYCYQIEVKEAMQMHSRKEAVVIPIILRPCDWSDAPFGRLLALPTDGKPVIKFPSLDYGFLDIVKGIKAVTSRLNKKAEKVVEQLATVLNRSPSPRSSNLTIKKVFSDHDKDQHLKESFTYICNFFEGSLEELRTRNSEITYLTDRVDSKTFTASVYVSGSKTSEGMIFLGSTSFSHGINYSSRISESKNSINDSLNVIDDGNSLLLKPLGLSAFGSTRSEGLTNEGAAEYYWQLFVKPLQERR